MFIHSKDLRIEFYKSSGPGGQHKNKRSTAVRITHLPSGLKAIAEEERSQTANKEIALRRLKERLAQFNRPKKSRIATKIPRAVKQRILKWKKRQSLKKSFRRKNIEVEE